MKIARCFAFVGPYLPLDANYAIGNFIGHVLNETPLRIEGDGTPYRSYLYASDLVIWLWTILFRGVSGRAYNVGSEEAISISALAAHTARAASPELLVTIGKKAVPSLPPQRYVPSTARARQELGLAETVDLPEGIARTIGWHRWISEQGGIRVCP